MPVEEKSKQFYWHANTSSGGTLSLDVNFDWTASRKEKEYALADAVRQCVQHMEKEGFIPGNARLMSSRDIAEEYGKSRQYWEKLLNEGRILYKETSAGRITTNLWVSGYLGNKEEVDGYVKNVRTVLDRIRELGKRNGSVECPVCKASRFEFYANGNGNTNGLCRSCGFHVHTTE